MANKTRIRSIVKQAGIMDMLSGAASSVAGYAPEGLGGLMGAGAATGLAQLGGAGDKGQMIAAAIGATVGAMAASKMKEHEQMQTMGIDANANLGINNALMNLDQEAALSGMYGGMPMDPNMMMGGGMPMGGMPMDPSMMGGGQQFPPSNPVSGYPDAQQAMQQDKQASASLAKTASEVVNKYFS